jgi:DNA-directed RNA polymerase subunit RPC12/RpoP
MEQRTYRGDIDPEQFADALVAQFDGGDLKAQKVGRENHVLVQIASRDWALGGPQTALTVGLARVEGGVEVSLGQQRWLGAVADLAQTGLMALINPLSLLHRIDDIARSVSGLTLPQRVWEAVEHYCQSVGASLGLTAEMTMIACPYCGVGNQIGAPKCSACGAPLGEEQPVSCPRCGLLMEPGAHFCSRCGTELSRSQQPQPEDAGSGQGLFRRGRRGS